ncbi:MAG: CorA family divalent cation transporter [Cytophagales bacterium]|nr:CorA family divalent cation transporter [Cytophagales bacterium]
MVSTLKEKKESGYEWIDITNPTKTELSDVASRYGLHPALVEDSLQPEHLPKFEMVGDIQFVILRLFSSKATPEADTIQEVTDKIAVFIGNEFIITIHRQSYDFLPEIKSKYVDTGKCTTPHHLLFRIISKSMATFEVPLAELVKELDYYEPKIFLQKKTPSLLKNLYYIKRRAAVMDHIFELSKVILENLKGKIGAIHSNQLKDEFLRFQTSARQAIDNVANLLNIYISLSSQRTNEVVRVLTVFSVFFMPLTFIAGVYGMNFDIMPELRWEYGYLFAMLFMVAVTAIIYFWFRRKGWM